MWRGLQPIETAETQSQKRDHESSTSKRQTSKRRTAEEKIEEKSTETG
jgi:hypothetical protein